eukprot:TRINITY_DN777_c1_g1_i1.p1 TRINITY_DN777_c1_g1~~TRINITY_DN777_c1_g1_i1.p1  ORF type:complete len:988 (+),score=203.56 TRINITY_DN777_c1_g1_i1:57-3020(+)
MAASTNGAPVALALECVAVALIAYALWVTFYDSGKGKKKLCSKSCSGRVTPESPVSTCNTSLPVPGCSVIEKKCCSNVCGCQSATWQPVTESSCPCQSSSVESFSNTDENACSRICNDIPLDFVESTDGPVKGTSAQCSGTCHSCHDNKADGGRACERIGQKQELSTIDWQNLDPPGKILYASQTGTARALAEELGVRLRDAGIPVVVVDPAGYEPEDLPKEKLLLLVVSTWEDGSVPAHASFLGQWLEESATDFRVGSTLLDGVRFSVFGVGSGAYGETFNQVAKAMDAQLHDLGAHRLAPMRKGDVDLEGGEEGGVVEEFARWSEGVVRSMEESSTRPDDGAGEGEGGRGGEVPADFVRTKQGEGKAGVINGVAFAEERIGDVEEHIKERMILPRGLEKYSALRENGNVERNGIGSTLESSNHRGKNGVHGGEGRMSGENGKDAEEAEEDEEIEADDEAAVEDDQEDEDEDEEEEEEEERSNTNSLGDLEDIAGKASRRDDDWDWAGRAAGEGNDDVSGSGVREANGTLTAGREGGKAGMAGRGGINRKWFVRKTKKEKAEATGGGGGETANERRRNASKTAAVKLQGATGGGLGGDGADKTGAKEMVTPVVRANLEKQGYKVLGSHSGVKLCRWTKSQLRGRGGCYKHSFYGIESHRCMEATPSLACANKCVFCWRHHTNPVGKSWRWQVDAPDAIVNAAIEAHCGMIRQMKGVPGVKSERLTEGMTPRHCALSLVGEPIMYPHINELVGLLHQRRISTFLVTNAQFPERIAALSPITQLYVSVDAATKESLKAIDRPLFADFWERFLASLRALREKRQRTVYRLTLVKGWNMEEVAAYASLLEHGSPDFIEIKGVTYCGSTSTSSLTMQNVPWHADVKAFAEAISAARNGEYELACEHVHSCCVVLAKTAKFKKDGRWYTWIDYERFQDLVASGSTDFGSEDYMALTPEWALYGANEGGFDPKETRVKKERRHGAAADPGGCT